MLVAVSKDADKLPCLQRCAAAAILSLPQALNQGRPLNAADVLHFLAFAAILGCVAYLGAFWQFWFFTRFFMRRSYRTLTLHRSSTVFGVAGALFIPTMYFANLIVPESIWGATEVGIMIAFLIASFVGAIRILRRGELQTQAGEIVDCPK